MRRTELRRPPQGLKAGSLKRKTAPRRSQPKRDWTDARDKVEREGQCRFHGALLGCAGALETAHVVGRKHDERGLCPTCEGTRWVDVGIGNFHGPPGYRPAQHLAPCADCEDGRISTLYVDTRRVVPLCRHHHKLYDAHEIDLLPVLSLDEQVQAVRDADGVENMRVRTAPSCYRGSA